MTNNQLLGGGPGLAAIPSSCADDIYTWDKEQQLLSDWEFSTSFEMVLDFIV